MNIFHFKAAFLSPHIQTAILAVYYNFASPFTVLAVVCNGLSLPVSATTGSVARQNWGVPGGVSLPPPQAAGAFWGGAQHAQG